MYNNKTFLAIIPARSGSKGLTDKNIKLMKDKPLMAYTIEACVKSNIFDEIIVSTDSINYAKVARDYGAKVPFLRPDNLASDVTPTAHVILHVLDEMRNLGNSFDYFMLLQPTSPLRNEIHILESASILFDKSADSVISICEAEHPTYLNVKLNKLGQLDVLFQNKNQARRQDIAQEFRLNGAIYLTSTEFFLRQKSFYGGNTFPYLMNSIHSIDIDDDFQFNLAEYVMKQLPETP